MARSRVYLPLRRDGLLTLQAGALPAGAEVGRCVVEAVVL